MRKQFVAVFLFALAVLGFSPGAQQEKPPRQDVSNGKRIEIPDIIPRTGVWDVEGYPHPWISAAALTDAAGFTINATYLNLSVYPRLGDQVLTSNKKGIAAFNAGTEPPPFIPVTWEADLVVPSANPPSTLRQLIDSASFVAIGIVEEAVGGFFHGNPGNLLRIRVDTWRGRDKSPAQSEVLFFWPGGPINIGHATILASLDGVPQPPQVGEQIVIFPELGTEPAPFLSFDQSRSGELGAAAKFTPQGIQVSARMAAQLPAIARIASFSDFSAQLDIAISGSALR